MLYFLKKEQVAQWKEIFPYDYLFRGGSSILFHSL